MALSTSPYRTAEEYVALLSKLIEIEGLDMTSISSVIIASVVPQTVFPLKQFCKRYLKCEALVIGEANVNLNISIKMDYPSEVGADRLVNSIAAKNRYGNDVIIIDFGTATNFDVVDTNGDYIGGVIAPGINLSLDALPPGCSKIA